MPMGLKLASLEQLKSPSCKTGYGTIEDSPTGGYVYRTCEMTAKKDAHTVSTFFFLEIHKENSIENGTELMGFFEPVFWERIGNNWVFGGEGRYSCWSAWLIFSKSKQQHVYREL